MGHDPQKFELDGVTFGAWPGVGVRRFTPAGPVIDVKDQPSATGHGMIPGRDALRGATWMWELTTPATTTEAQARDILAPLAAAWAAGADLPPSQTQTLRYQLAGRWRRVYGRARRWTPPPSGPALAAGRADVTAEFQVMDPLFYADVADQIQIGSVPASSGGLLAPLVGPLSTLRSGTPDTRFVTVGGDAPTPLTVVFRGPVVRPWVRLGSVQVALTGSLAYDQAVTVDARTRTVLWTAGRSGSAAGLLDPRARLAELALGPGRHEVQFGGTDETGTATCMVSWRDAWRSL